MLWKDSEIDLGTPGEGKHIAFEKLKNVLLNLFILVLLKKLWPFMI